MSETELPDRELVRDCLTAFNEQDRDLMTELLAAEVIEHGIRDEHRGVEEILESLDAHFETFPDYGGTTEAIVAEDDLVTVRHSATETHTRHYRDIEPTGHTVEWGGIAIYRVEDGEIAEI
ncbi:ester cyclase [Halorubrum sp. BOL3-1]|uniref:ester cyclase n=1 Tax=Halorubrum sp. BOL3-1 TaxID=2497325 RepID=UPI0019D59FB7|nr:ester cyclase [Halorubrum sp. BOL3-1]